VSKVAERTLIAVKDHPNDPHLLWICYAGHGRNLEATHAIRDWDGRTRAPAGRPLHARIVALTADAVKSDSERCKQMGMDGYLTKPIDPDQILRVIKQLFS
jgi:CheY-like chemotaxis protein